ncbi:cysteine proteinase, partial [Russula decolorans]
LFDEATDSTGCTHISALLADFTESDTLLKRFRRVVTWKAQRTHDALHSAKRRKVALPTCGTCGLATPRPFVCLDCAFSGCWQDDHIVEHLKDENHRFCVDTQLGSVFCRECQDVIYDPTLDDLYQKLVRGVEERETKHLDEKRPREPYQSWKPGEKDIAALDNTTPLPCQGQRGLLNLGQTCFLNATLQSLLHNPLLRNYFLGDKHNPRWCKTKEDCACCELDRLFAATHTPSPPPSPQSAFGPTALLATSWRAAGSLAGYAQQDAHECLIALLNAAHASARGSTLLKCNCIVHSTFGGMLQSDMRCPRCNSLSETIDPCLDISLGLGLSPGQSTLAGYLKRFTQPENIAVKDWICQKCGKVSQEANKRLSFKRLPPVLSIQFKRFEQRGTETYKIDTPVRVPVSINMAPYTTATLDGSGTYPGPEALYDYELFALINHEGQIDNGHYTSFARFQDTWCRFDDDKVTPATLASVLGTSAPIYMAFYVKRRLDYKPHITPSYVLTRESEAVREREALAAKAKQEQEQARERELEVDNELLATVLDA